MRYSHGMITLAIKSAGETKRVARFLAHEMSARPDAVGTRGLPVRSTQTGAAVLALSGELGAGKTTFAQGFARALGVREKVKSPTFVLMKVYDIPSKSQVPKSKFKHFIHIDCYRLASPKDLLPLGFKGLLKDKDAIMLIEWAERIKKILPRDAIWCRFIIHGDRRHERMIVIDENIARG